MRIKPDESKEDWAKRVQQFEYGYALQRIAQGDAVDLVLDEMSKRITQKLIHPFIQDIKNAPKPEFDLTASKQSYKEKYLDKTKPAADQVSELPTDYDDD